MQTVLNWNQNNMFSMGNCQNHDIFCELSTRNLPLVEDSRLSLNLILNRNQYMFSKVNFA